MYQEKVSVSSSFHTNQNKSPKDDKLRKISIATSVAMKIIHSRVSQPEFLETVGSGNSSVGVPPESKGKHKFQIKDA